MSKEIEKIRAKFELERDLVSYENLEKYSVWLEYEYLKLMKQVKNNSVKTDVSGRSELLPFSFVEWYSGMGKEKIKSALKRWDEENGNCH